MIEERFAPGSNPALTDSGLADPRGFHFLRHASPILTAVLIDAAFFLVRVRHVFGRLSPDAAARQLHRISLDHLNDEQGRRIARLYRIFVYDAPPSLWRGHTPIANATVNLAESPEAQWRLEFHRILRGMRKVALRLGEVSASHVQWQLRPRVLSELARGRRIWTDLTDNDFRLDLRQKGVDMRIGLDIASLAFKRQINQLVLISGDSDFVPAAKLARREGIDFILDPMWATIRPDLHEHVDGMRSVCPRPRRRSTPPPRN